ncbi:methyltransferase domain-containing protein [Cycloclasticus pugetii]|jgi:SAM-dependent methyltransferase|uniref:methyltransferase domain-containing protein n=1 Tax=Cycloclasticus pugetii TaxID=34068 RepID=UPI00092057FA|nr:class I SAM-dependent methyltransferase [Cycloclasticus pugetii]SHJ54120.1 Methyltransferase domain-containing protein [Cycloclasticus pugetii]
MLISKQHNNRKAHNWLVYDIGDRFRLKTIPFYNGVLYDLGCGESRYKNFFLEHAEEYIGVDWADSFHNTSPDIVADLNKPLPIESEVADTIVSFSVMEHLCEPQMMLNEAFRILKPNGKIVLQVPWQWWVHEAPYDFFRYTPYGLKYMFEKAGFEAVEVQAQSGFFSMLIMKVNYFTARFICGPRLLRLVIRMGLIPFWYVGQKLAPILDKLDKNWAAETNGYYVTARKP